MNELKKAESLYLKQHAKNPIHWKSWSQQALDTARNKDKLIVLSIGYAACHWCHVMEKETFTDPMVANLMNSQFISIKVDREEHPDVDHVYMDFLLETKGNGGWPLNCILLPDGRPIYAGTYFKKDQWIQLLSRFQFLYNENPQKLKDIALDVMEQIEFQNEMYSTEVFKVQEDWLEWVKFLDLEHGNLNYSQKFPMPSVSHFLMHIPDDRFQHHVTLSLDAMVNRGLYDHLDGGFFRYCVDREWHIPHFEKMLYDNAQMISLLSRYDLLHSNNKYKNPVFDTITFLYNDFYTSLFASSIDADNVEGEGKYYTFSNEEILDNFSKVEQEYFQTYFISSVNKLWEDRWHLHGDVNQVSKEKNKIKKELSEIRATHPIPAIDFKQICSWNSLMVIGLIDAAIAYKNEKWAKEAEIVLQKMITVFLDDSTIYRVVYKYNKKEGCLEDYACFIAAMIKMGSIHRSGYYFRKAISLVELVINDFFDRKKKLFRFSNEQSLYKTKFEVEDQVIPSSNSIMAQNLLSLYEVTRKEKYLDLATQMFDSVAEKAKKWLPNYSNWMHVKRKYNHSKPKIVMCNVDFSTICDLIHQIKTLDFTYVLENEVSITLFKGKYNPTNRNIFVCGDQYCFEPVESIKEAIKLYDEAI